MKCIKTGIKFQINDQPETWHGDMYYIKPANVYLIMGIPKGYSNITPNIIIRPFKDMYEVIFCSDEFNQFMTEWNSEYPKVEIIIIADSRFI